MQYNSIILENTWSIEKCAEVGTKRYFDGHFNELNGQTDRFYGH